MFLVLISVQVLRMKSRNRIKGKKLWLDIPLRGVDVMRLSLYMRVVANSFDGAMLARCSRCSAVVKTFTNDYWLRLTQPANVMTLVAESNATREFVLRFLLTGVIPGRYVRSGTDYLQRISS
jgi:hypothetical protein